MSQLRWVDIVIIIILVAMWNHVDMHEALSNVGTVLLYISAFALSMGAVYFISWLSEKINGFDNIGKAQKILGTGNSNESSKIEYFKNIKRKVRFRFLRENGYWAFPLFGLILLLLILFSPLFLRVI